MTMRLILQNARSVEIKRTRRHSALVFDDGEEAIASDHDIVEIIVTCGGVGPARPMIEIHGIPDEALECSVIQGVPYAAGE